MGKRIAINLPATGDTEKTEVRNSGRKQEGRKGETSFRQRRHGVGGGGGRTQEAARWRRLATEFGGYGGGGGGGSGSLSAS